MRELVSHRGKEPEGQVQAMWSIFTIIGALLALGLIVGGVVFPPRSSLFGTLRRSEFYYDRPTLIAEIAKVDGWPVEGDSANVRVSVGTHRVTVTCRSTVTGEVNTETLALTVVAGGEYAPFPDVDERAKPCVAKIDELIRMRI